jgi:hypothetical protein
MHAAVVKSVKYYEWIEMQDNIYRLDTNPSHYGAALGF